MKKIASTLIAVLVFLCGLFLFLYPTVSNMYNEYLNRQLAKKYENAFAEMDVEKKNEEMQKAVSYNENKDNEEKLKELGLTYESVLNLGDNGVMGYIEIPKISVSLMIYHSIEGEVLEKGIGHVPDSALPVGGESTHCVLAGHSGLPSAKLLTNIDHLKVGDQFYIHVLNEVFSYQIDDISVVEPTEVAKLNVISGKDCVTLVTCTPYGVNSHRLLVRGVRVEDDGNLVAKKDSVLNEILNIEMKYLVTVSLIGIFLILITVKMIRKTVKNKNAKKGAVTKDAGSIQDLPKPEDKGNEN